MKIITFKVIVLLNYGFNFYLIYINSEDILNINIFESLASKLPAHSNEYMPHVTTLNESIQRLLSSRITLKCST